MPCKRSGMQAGPQHPSLQHHAWPFAIHLFPNLLDPLSSWRWLQQCWRHSSYEVILVLRIKSYTPELKISSAVMCCHSPVANHILFFRKVVALGMNDFVYNSSCSCCMIRLLHCNLTQNEPAGSGVSICIIHHKKVIPQMLARLASSAAVLQTSLPHLFLLV